MQASTNAKDKQGKEKNYREKNLPSFENVFKKCTTIFVGIGSIMFGVLDKNKNFMAVVEQQIRYEMLFLYFESFISEINFVVDKKKASSRGPGKIRDQNCSRPRKRPGNLRSRLALSIPLIKIMFIMI